jgi:hypothetical protein
MNSLITGLYSVLSYIEEEFEDSKGIIRIRKSKKDRQQNGQKKKYKRTTSSIAIDCKIKRGLIPQTTNGRLYYIHKGSIEDVIHNFLGNCHFDCVYYSIECCIWLIYFRWNTVTNYQTFCANNIMYKEKFIQNKN